mgnify:FL=1
MSSSALRRTIRRCTAVLLIPISMTPWVFIAWLKTKDYPHLNFILIFGDYITIIMVLSAVLYLSGSFWVQLGRKEEETVAEDIQTE